MTGAARNDKIVAFFHFNDVAGGEFQGRRPAQHDHPFVFALIVPKPGRTAVRARDDSFDSHRAVFEERRKLLRARGDFSFGKNVFDAEGHDHYICARLIGGTATFRHWPGVGGFSTALTSAWIICSMVTSPSRSAVARVAGIISS